MTHSHTIWNVSWFNQIGQVCHHTHEHHTIHKYLVLKILCVLVSQNARFTRLYFSILNRLFLQFEWTSDLSSYFDQSEWTSVQVINFFVSRNCFTYFLPATANELFLWLAEQNVSMIKNISTVHNLLHYWLIPHFVSTTGTGSCVYHSTLLIDVNTTNFNPS
jgi:hypothetical protein